MKAIVLALCLVGLMVLAKSPMTAGAASAEDYRCPPTLEDEMGPFYRPKAPLRSKIGSGYLLTGIVKSARDCAPLSHALIEFWQAGPDSRYDDNHRAAIITGESGTYQFETTAPAPYFTRPAHIHIRVEAAGFQVLVTQHYLQKKLQGAVFDLVLVPEP
jgi:protocatechuate 3,4-dioxygenase beta subunit